MSRAVCIIAAYNEAGRVGAVVRVARDAGLRVLVVDDGSSDTTASEARAAGAEVIVLTRNGGKGAAMRAGVEATTEDVVVFADADLKGLRAEHLRLIADPVVRGDFDMVVGLRDYGEWNRAVRQLPLISGERAVRRAFLRRMPNRAWHGFGIEVWMNDTLARFGGRVGTVVLNGVQPTLKWEKEGATRGLAKMADMGAEVVTAMQGIVEHYNGPPPTLAAKCSSTECVADALAASAARAFGPMWTPEAQSNVGRGIGQSVAIPLWGTLGVVSYLAAGWPGAVVSAAALVFSTAKRRPVINRRL